MNPSENAQARLKRAIAEQAEVLEGKILDVTSFLNHGVDTDLVKAIAEYLATLLRQYGPTKILTTETSGIAPAYAVAVALGGLPLVFARRNLPITMVRSRVYTASTISATRGEFVRLYVSDRVLLPTDRVAIVDDFLASGKTLLALLQIVRDAGCLPLAVCAVIEKAFENGRTTIRRMFPDIPIFSVVTIASVRRGRGQITFAAEE